MKIAGIVLGALTLLVLLYGVATVWFINPSVAREIRDNPEGERARKVMMLTLPSGKSIPVNYWREGDKVFAAADGGWWRELRGDGVPVTVFVRGEELRGRARTVEDDPEYRSRVFAQLRPTAPSFTGTMIEIQLAR